IAQIIEYSKFTYIEKSDQANLTETPPRILAIKHYHKDANTSIVHIGRENYISGTNLCLEQRLLLRVLQENGNVIEINFNNTKEIQDINYCYVNGKNPINIHPLFGKYILVSYVHANDTSDSTTYIDRGMVIDWDGNIISIIDFGPSCLLPNSTIWEPNELIVNNIAPQKGFLRLSRVRGTNHLEWRQYGHRDNGNFNLLQNNTFITDSTDFTDFQVTMLQTLDNGYIIIYSNTLFASAKLYAMKLKYNEKTSVKFILYQSTQPNITFTSIFCSDDYVNVGHLCFASVASTVVTKVPTNTTTIATTALAPLTTSTVLHVRPTTFNEPGAQYYIQMENNFVQNSKYDEAIPGIDPNVWTCQTANIDISQRSIYAGNIVQFYKVNLYRHGSLYFEQLSDSARSDFITILINELTRRIPTEKDRLSSDMRYQFDATVESQILISLSISQAKSDEKLLSTELAKNLNQLIINGAYTGISTGTTTIYLDYNYGFQPT
ncbi:5987_t:CDS:2, partial [Racocetra persica]